MSEQFQKLKAFLDSLYDRFGVPAFDLLIYKEHDLLYRHMSGFSDIAKTKTVSKNDLYLLFSATKVVTSAAALQLVERERISLSDPLSMYLPSFKDMSVAELDWNNLAESFKKKNKRIAPASSPILIRHLLTMTAGLTYNYLAEEMETLSPHASTREVTDAIARIPLAYEPGAHWMYSLAHDVLAAVVEVASGLSFMNYLTENIFEPLGMSTPTFHIDASKVSQLYRPGADGSINPVPIKNHLKLSENHESGGAGLICSAEDYALFADALCNGGIGKTGARILGNAMIDAMSSNWLNKTQEQDFALFNRKGYSYGLGVRTLIDNTSSRSPIGEFGWDGAAGAYVLVDAKNHLCIFYAQHVLDYGSSYYEIHPALRDLTYEELGI
jgi:CubicO group peptidase (beta-lactamase class C family)